MKDDQSNPKEGEKALPSLPARDSANRGQVIDGDGVERSLGTVYLQEQQQQGQAENPSSFQDPNTQLTQYGHTGSRRDLSVQSRGQQQTLLPPSDAPISWTLPSLRRAVSPGDQPLAIRRRSFFSQVRVTLQETWRAVGNSSSRRRSRQVEDALDIDGDMVVAGDKADRDIETASYYTDQDGNLKALYAGPSAWIITPMGSSISSLGGTFASEDANPDFSGDQELIPEEEANPPAHQITSIPGAFRLRPGDNRMRPAGIEQSSSSSVQSSSAQSIAYTASNSTIQRFINRNDLVLQDSTTFFVPRANVIDDASVTPDPIALFDVFHASPLDASFSLESLAPEDAVILNRRVVKCFVIGILFVLFSLGTALYVAMKSNEKTSNSETIPVLNRPENPSASIPTVNVSETGLGATDFFPDMTIDYDSSASGSGLNNGPSLSEVLEAENTLQPGTFLNAMTFS